MSRSLVLLIVIVLAIGGLLWLLAGMDGDQPQTRVEKVVPLENLSR